MHVQTSRRRPGWPGLPVATALLLCFSPSPPAQGCAAGPPTQLGRVISLTTACRGGPGGLAGTTCRALRVECAGIPPIEVEVRVTDPRAGTPLRGTVVFGVGGGGVGFYGDRTGGAPIMTSLLAAGFRIVDRSWRSSWFGNSVSVRKQSCRYATLLTWIHANLHTTGAFCATGNSGGSAEICYALTSWARGDILDVAVPTGGPPMARLDLLCQNPPTQQWLGLCQAIVPPNVMEVQPACTVNPGHPVCRACSTSATAADLRADSILHPAAVLDYPRTRVHQIFGARDGSSALPNGMLFFSRVTSEKVREFVPGTPHWTAETALGQEAIVRAILGGAACRPGPGTLSAPGWPQVGGSLELAVLGPPGGLFAVFLSLNVAQIELPGLGWVFIGPPLLPLGGGTLDPREGRGRVSVAMPATPSLAGIPLFDQGVAGSCLTNLVRTEILP